MIRIISLFSCIFLISQCKTKSYTPYDFNGSIITIGTGGGYTGKVREFSLLENGQVFFGTNEEGFVNELESLDKREAKQIFRNYASLNFAKLNIDKPGNMYHYIVFQKNGVKHKIQWGAYDANPPRELLIFFANLKRQFSNKSIFNSTNQ